MIDRDWPNNSPPSFVTALRVEQRKLRRSLALLLALAAPVLIAVFLFFNLLRDHQPRPWDMWMANAAAVWAFFMLPMSVTALTALVAQVEHGSRAWDHLRALPLPRWHLYTAKLAWVLVVVALMSVAIALTGAAAVGLAGKLRPALAPTGEMHSWIYLARFGRMYLASLLLIAIQLWVALRYASFVPALAVGIGGTFFAVVAMSAQIGVVIPWLIPINVLANDPMRAQIALAVGLVGGLVAVALMLVDLSRREVM